MGGGPMWQGRIAALFVLFACVLPALPIFALDPTKSITQYVHDVWQTEQGLPVNGVEAILQTRDGYLWLGTQEGLVRFDGVTFTVFDKSNTEEITGNWILALLEDRNGNLWIGTNGGLNRFKDGKFTGYTTRDGLSNDFAQSLYEDHEGNLWIGTNSGGLNRFKDGIFTSYATEAGLSKDRIWSVYEDRRRNLWIGTNVGLFRFSNGKFTGYTTKDGLADNTVYSLHEDLEGSLWIGTSDGLNRFQNGKFAGYAALAGRGIRSIYQDREGNLWIGTQGAGLHRFKDGIFTSYSTKEGLPNDDIRALHEDREGNLWVGTYGGGLNRFRDGIFSSYTTQDGLSNDFTRSVYEDREGTLWIGTTGGLNRFRDKKFTSYTTIDGLSNNEVLSMLEDREGNLWIGTRNGLNRFKNGKFTNYTTKEGLSNNIARSLYQDREGSLWIATFGGLNRFRAGKFTSYTVKEGLSKNELRAVYGDRKGDLWIATFGSGLDRFKNGKFTNYTTKEGLSNGLVHSLYEDVAGTLWVGTYGGGLNRFKDGKFTSYTTKEGMFDDWVHVIMEDGKGNLWMSCNKGIFRVSKKDLNDFADGKIPRITSVSYGTADGMKSRECNGGGPAGWKSRDGRLWFSTMKGVVVVDPDNMKINKKPPPVIIEQLKADTDTISTNALAEIELRPGIENLEFHYTGLSFVAPERVLFKYKVEGYDKDWVDAGTRRVAYYTHLPAGRYTFRVKTCNNDGVWNEAGAALPFTLKPHFYQTSWFYIICILFAAQAAVSVHRYRIRTLKKKEEELVRVVDEKTRDLRNTNRKLAEAQDRISKLLESQPHALENISSWAGTISEDIARVIGATEIAVWVLEDEKFQAVSRTDLQPPTLEEINSVSANIHPQEETIVPVTGASGRIYGAVTVSGKNVIWGDTERRLITGLVQQLGSAMEMQKLQQELASAKDARAVTLRELHDRGIATLQVCPRCGGCFDHTSKSCKFDSVELETPRILPYRILDRYRLIRMLGQGGIGIVFEAYDEKVMRSVAVKILRKESLDDPLMRIRWEREAQIVSRLHHPGIVDLHDLGELPDGSSFLVMEFLHGLDLARIVKLYGPGTPSQVAEVLMQAGEALTCAHDAGVIHRDLKPANLFLVPQPSGFQIKVLDFGLAKSMNETNALTRTGMLVGTPAYMSPEQIREQILDTRSDLFSLAAVTYELLTGKIAFYAEFAPEIFVRVLLENPDPLSAVLLNVNHKLESSLLHALEKDPKKRPKTVAEWIADFVPLLKSTTTSKSGWNLKDLQQQIGAVN